MAEVEVEPIEVEPFGPAMPRLIPADYGHSLCEVGVCDCDNE